MFKKRIPTLVGMLLLLVGAVAGVLFLDESTDFLPRAAPEYVPQKVKITNISDSSLTISWLTEEPSIGFIKLGSSADQLDTTVIDERDQLTGSSNEFRSHYITIQELKPSSTYYFKLGSHSKQLYDNNGDAFSITTGPPLSTAPSSDTAYGSIYTPAETPAEGAIVYLSLPGATPLSALVKKDGNWAVSLSVARSANLSNYVSYDLTGTPIDLLVQADNGDTSQVTTTTDNDQPVPDIILGENADYTGNEPVYLQQETELTQDYESQFTLQELEVTDPDSDTTITIDTIPADDTIINQTQPELTGSAPPGIELIVTIHSSQVITGNIVVDTNGSWDWTPPRNLELGNHTITLSYADEEGILHTLSRSFIVQAAESIGDNLPQYEATPSATITPSPTQEPTPEITPSTTQSPTPSPTSTPSPTPRPTAPATISAIPVAGTTTPTIALFALGIIFLLSGLIAFKRSI